MDELASCPDAEKLDAYASGERDDAPLRAHIESCDTCAQFVHEARENLALERRLRTRAFERPAIGVVIEGYEIESELGRGGQGVVYRAIQLSTQRTVALKVLLAGTLATSRQRRRFEREVELVAGLHHPNIVTVYDGGICADGRQFLAMQLVEGVSLTRWIRSGGCADRDKALALFLSICDAVAAAHRSGVLHRDLKPDNIIIDSECEPHVLDFGLARDLENVAEGRSLTIGGGFLGTLAYAAPEQLTGQADVDARADVHALGSILHEMLTGQPAVDVTGELAEILEQLTTADPAPPGVNGDLDVIVMKARAVDRQRRYQSVDGLAADVERHRSALPIEARRDSGWYVFRRTVSRHRGKVAVVVAFAAMLMVFSGAMFVAYQQASTEARKLRQINVFLEDTLGSVQAGGDGEATVGELLDEAVLWIDLVLRDEPEVAASIRLTAGNSYRALGRFDDAQTQLQTALETYQSLFGGNHPDVARSLNALGLLRRSQGRYDEAETFFREALAIRRMLHGDKHFDVSITLANMAINQQAMGDVDEARRLMLESLAIREGLFGKDHADVAMCHFSLGEIERSAGNTSAARREHERAAAIRRHVLPAGHPDLIRSEEALSSLRQ